MRQHAQPQVVEIEPSGVVWLKSSASASSGTQDCIELSLGEVVMIRDSRDRNGPYLVVSPRAWLTFLSRASC